MIPLILLAGLLGQCPPGVVCPAPARTLAPGPAGWRSFEANPKYEVFGRIENGVFRYTQSRPKPAPPAKPTIKTAPNFGVNLPEHEPILRASDFEVRGTDKALGEVVAEAAIKPVAAAIISDVSGQCRPFKPRIPVVAPLAMGAEMIVLYCLLGVFLLFVGLAILFIKIAIIFLVCRWLYRKLTQPPATPVA